MAIECQTEQGEWIRCPLFFGTNLEAWIVAIQRFFHQFQIPEEQYVNLAYHHLRVSSNWGTQYEKSTICWSWFAFVGALREEFDEPDFRVQQEQSNEKAVEEVNQREQEHVFERITSQEILDSTGGLVKTTQSWAVHIIDEVLKDGVECQESDTGLLLNSSLLVGLQSIRTSQGKVNLDALACLELLVQGNHSQVPFICWCYYGLNFNCNDSAHAIFCISSFATLDKYPTSEVRCIQITKYMEFLNFKFKEYTKTIDYDDAISENMAEIVVGYPKFRDNSQSIKYAIDPGEGYPSATESSQCLHSKQRYRMADCLGFSPIYNSLLLLAALCPSLCELE